VPKSKPCLGFIAASSPYPTLLLIVYNNPVFHAHHCQVLLEKHKVVKF
jgi:hypothetical protein